MEIERIDDTSVSAGGQRLSTAEVERVIHDLAVARVSMRPPIPDREDQVAGPHGAH